MAPQLALLLCLILIATLLVRDFRRRETLSVAVWLPTVLLLILSSRPVTLWFGLQGVVVSADNYVEGSPFDRAFYLALILGSGAIATWRNFKWNKFIVANAALTLFYVYFAVSVLWSADPLGSFKRLFKDVGLVVIAAVLMSEKDPLEAIRAVYVRCASVLIPMSVVFIKYFPHLGREYSRGGAGTYTGVTTQKNGLGEIVMIFSLFLLWDYLATRSVGQRGFWKHWDRLLLFVIGLWLLSTSQSKTALMCMLIGLMLLGVGARFGSAINRGILLGALSLPFLLFFTQQFTQLMSPLISALGRDMTFTGRTDIWRAVLAQDFNPFIGAGYWNFWGNSGGDSVRELLQVVEMKSAHNGYLDIYVDGGLIGLTLLFGLLMTQGRRLLRSLTHDPYERLRFAILIVAILYNLSESTFARLTLTWFTTLMVLVDFRGGGAVERARGSEEQAQILTQPPVNIWEVGRKSTGSRIPGPVAGRRLQSVVP